MPQDFPNEEEDYGGPELLRTTPLTWTKSDGPADGEEEGGVRFVLVEENGMKHICCHVSTLPSTGSELMALFK